MASWIHSLSALKGNWSRPPVHNDGVTEHLRFSQELGFDLYALELVGGFVHSNGWQRSFHPFMKARNLALTSLTDPKLPRWMVWRSMMPNHTSTRLSHDPEVEAKWTRKRRVLLQPDPDLGRPVGGHSCP